VDHLFQVLPSIIRKIDGDLEIEVDFGESLRLYLENFDRVSVACVVTTETTDSGLRRCRRVTDLPWRDRVRFIPLPNAYSFGQFARHYHGVRRVLKNEIENANYLLFSPHTLIGDWPTVATREAIKLQRPYVIEADVVYDEVANVESARGAWKSFINKNFAQPLFRQSHHYCLKHSSLALLQGQDVYNAYSPFSKNPHKVYHMPVSKADYITEAELQQKLSGLNDFRALKLCYVGRAIDMKGPMDWLKILHELITSGVELSATWLGDGSLLPDMRAMADSLGIAGHVTFSGYIADRARILSTLKDSDMVLFCHKTPESPRCLVEALASGCPLIGYGSAYPKEIVAQRGGGEFVTVGNWKELVNLVKVLDKDREKLRKLIEYASASGRLYERDATMQRRIDLIKEYLIPPAETVTRTIEFRSQIPKSPQIRQ
jgi:glycosyltransferase involved in cell wall biosynthesis